MPKVSDASLETWTLADGTRLKMRNITPADAAIEQAFVRGLSPQTRYFRFHGTVRELSDKQLHDLTCLDPDISTAFIVLFEGGNREEEIAVGRYIIDRDGTGCEIAVVVGDAWQRRGIGTRLMNSLIEHARAQGVTRFYDFVLKSNRAMREWSERLGFRESGSPDDSSVVVLTKVLTAPTQ